MDHDERSDDSPARAPYETPRIEETANFQHVVLTCAKSTAIPLDECEEIGFES